VYFSGPEIYFTKFWYFFISHLASNFKTPKSWLPSAGVGKGMLDWLGKVSLISNLK